MDTYDNLTLNDTKQFYDELRYIPDDLQEDEIEGLLRDIY